MGRKVKTHKKKNSKVSQKESLSTFSLSKLLLKAQEEINTYHFNEAQTYCQEALKREPDNLKALEISANLCIETDNLDGAKHCLGRAITLCPETGFTKYLSMGQLIKGKDALNCYLKAIEILLKLIKKGSKNHPQSKCNKGNPKDALSTTNLITENGVNEDESETEFKISESSNHRKLSNAYCAVAELYMSDLCDEDAAEKESLSNIQNAVKSDPENPEAYQHWANFLLIKEKYEEAKDTIKKSVMLWLPQYQAVEDGEAVAGTFDPVDVCPLTQSTRFQTAQILIEVEEHKLAGDVLETLLGEDDEVIYTWYLIGWNHYLQNQKPEAKQHFEKAMELHHACPSSDEGIIEHTTELLKELKDIHDNSEDNDIESLEQEIEEMDVSNESSI